MGAKDKTFNPSNDTLEKVIENQYVTYKRKGFGIFFAFVITISYFFILQPLVREFYPYYVSQFSSFNSLYLFTILFINYFQFIIFNIFWYFIYMLKIPFFERYRIYPERPWMWESEPEKWRDLRYRTFRSIAFSLLVIIPAFLLLEVYNGPGVKTRMDIYSMPSEWETIKQVFFAMICEDFFFYWGHRILHLKALYPYIHKQHHEYNYPISISAENAHPIEFVLANIIPTSSGFLILGKQAHLISYVFWLVIRTAETFDGHSGYELSWSPFRLLPMSGSAQYHNYHHTHNDGNYSSFFVFWDTIQGTSKSYYKFMQKQQKEQQRSDSKKAN